jgi:hypothetical protein
MFPGWDPALSDGLIGETTLAPSHLGPAPEFGRRGESPPLQTEPVVISRALIAWGPPLTEQELQSWLLQPRKEAPPRVEIMRYLEAKRIVYRQYWKRDDPVLQLIPGETQSYVVQLNSGLTDQTLKEFSSNLGLGGKVSAAQLSAQLSGRLSRTVTISTELQTTATKQLTNTRERGLRRVAVWHVVHSVSLYKLAPLDPGRLHWRRRQHLEFADIAAPQSTYFDVRVR